MNETLSDRVQIRVADFQSLIPNLKVSSHLLQIINHVRTIVVIHYVLQKLQPLKVFILFISRIFFERNEGCIFGYIQGFDKIWHDGLLFKLKSYGISGCLFVVHEDFLHNGQQLLVLNRKNSDWSPLTAGVPQGSVLGPLFFLIYLNDIADHVSSEARLFADNTSLFTVVYDVDIAADKLNRDLDIISNWVHQ